MRRLALLAALVAIVGSFVHSVRVRQEEPAPRTPSDPVAHDPLTGAVLVDLDDDLSASDRDALEARIHEAIAPHAWPTGDAALGEVLHEGAQLFRLRDVPTSELEEVHAALAHDDVQSVELERRWSLPESAEAYRLDAAATSSAPEASRDGTFAPNDPFYRHQWHLDQIQMPKAWTRNRGEGVVVAVIDTGVAYRDVDGRFKQVPDLAEPRFVAGWDFVDGDDTPDDEHGHGTHVAGTIGANGNDGAGVAGVDWNCKLMTVRVLGRGGGSVDDIANGILWAAGLTNDTGTLPAQRADIINMSLGGPGLNSVLQQACDAAAAAGVLLIVAAGNDNTGPPNSPAVFDSVLSVGAVDLLGARAPYSNFHPSIDLWAPGGDLTRDRDGDGFGDGVLSCTADDSGAFGYIYENGTSMACPHVAGVAALVKAANPTLTAAQIRAILLAPGNTRPGASLPNSGRIVDALAAVQAAGAAVTGPVLVATPGVADFGSAGTTATVVAENRGQGAATTTTVTASPAAAWLDVLITETVAGNGLTNDTLTLTANRAGLPNGVYSTRLTWRATVGAATAEATVDVRLQVGVVAGASDEVFVLLVDPVFPFTTRYQVSARAVSSYQWSFANIAAGRYLLVAGTDRDNDDLIGDDGEWFGAWPNLDSATPLDLAAGATVNGLDFPLQDIVLEPAAVGAGGAKPTFRRLR